MVHRNQLILVAFVLMLCHSCFGTTGEELIKNGDFEDPFGEDNWYCASLKCEVAQTDSSFSGVYAAHVYNRVGKSEGVRQDVYLEKSKRYYISAYIKLLNDDPAYYWHQANIVAIVRGAINDRISVATQTQINTKSGWVKIGGDFVTQADTDYVTILVFPAQTDQVTYLLDMVSLTEIVPDPDWMVKADERVDLYRKGNLRINTNIQGSYNPSDITIWVNQTSSSFPFGCTALRTYITGTDAISQLYQAYFYDMFNWVTPTNPMKWRTMEAVQYEIDYTKTNDVVAALHANGMNNIRGHCIAWDKEDNIMDWLAALDREGIQQNLLRRAKYMVESYGGVVKHWDIMNEVIQGGWYEEKTGNTELVQGLFHVMKRLDPDSKLFLNDHGVLSRGRYASTYRRQAAMFRANGIPVDAMGIQAHLPGYDIHILKKRMDDLATAGVPIWITEFELGMADVSARATGIEEVLHLFYSLPAVEGIILWGFWNETHDLGTLNASFLDGPDFTENAAGKALRYLVKTKWRTHIAHGHPASAIATQNFRVHHGNYDITVLHNGQVVYGTTAQVEKNADVELQINLG